MSCYQCSQPIPDERRRRRAKYCSKECASASFRERYAKNNEAFRGNRPKLSTSTVGAIAEMVVAVDLMERGYEVFSALNPGAPCDLAILDSGGSAFRIQVRTGHRSAAGSLFYGRNPRDIGRHDVWAIVIHDVPREIVYLDAEGSPWAHLAGE